jgi:hypothetical protein
MLTVGPSSYLGGRCLPKFRSLQKSAGEIKSSFNTAVFLSGSV